MNLLRIMFLGMHTKQLLLRSFLVSLMLPTTLPPKHTLLLSELPFRVLFNGLKALRLQRIPVNIGVVPLGQMRVRDVDSLVQPGKIPNVLLPVVFASRK